MRSKTPDVPSNSWLIAASDIRTVNKGTLCARIEESYREVSINLRMERLSKSGRLSDKILRSKKDEDSIEWQKVGNGDEACYDRNVAYFTKRELNKTNVLHELYHHIAYVKNWEMSLGK